MVDRRSVLKGLAIAAASGALPSVALARAETEARLVVVILRGGVDGLALVPPHGDDAYARLRGELAIPAAGRNGGAHPLDGLFGLHPAMPALAAQYDQGQALFVHAVATPYRERSHFDGQDVLEHGGAGVGVLRDGWLNRALQPLGGTAGSEVAIAMAQNTPLILRGDQSVTSFSPSRLPGLDTEDDSTIARLQRLYADDAFFAQRLAQALNSRQIAAGMQGTPQRRGHAAAALEQTLQTTAKFLSAADGPRIAVLEAGGWDTHANQGAATGALARRLAALDAAIGAFAAGMGARWHDTAVAIVTEFGRTVRVNGTRGTDHGTAGAAIVTGGAVRGGRVIADWPGLSSGDLYQDRDLRPTTDLRSVFKALLIEHLHLDAAFVDAQVFPDSRTARALEGLMRG